MLWQIYLKNGTVYVPTVAETEAGFYVDVDPVKVIPVSDGEALQRAIKETIGRGNPKIPTPKPAAFLKSALLKYANVNSWSEFEKDSSCWKIVENGGSYRIKLQRNGSSVARGSCSYESCSGIDEVAAMVAALIQSASHLAIVESDSIPAAPPSTPQDDQPTLFPELFLRQTELPPFFELMEEAVVTRLCAGSTR